MNKQRFFNYSNINMWIFLLILHGLLLVTIQIFLANKTYNGAFVPVYYVKFQITPQSTTYYQYINLLDPNCISIFRALLFLILQNKINRCRLLKIIKVIKIIKIIKIINMIKIIKTIKINLHD